MSSSVAPARGRPRRSTSSSRDQYYPGAKRHPDEHDELSDSGSDGGYSENEGHRPHSPVEARPRRTRTLMTPQQLTILHALLQQVRRLQLHPHICMHFSTPMPLFYCFLRRDSQLQTNEKRPQDKPA